MAARRLLWIAVAVGLGVTVLGVVLLSTEVELFRYPHESDFGAVACGAPLDNPGWRTGQPCHGAVNRQTAVAWTAAVAGIGMVVAGAILAVRVGRSRADDR